MNAPGTSSCGLAASPGKPTAPRWPGASVAGKGLEAANTLVGMPSIIDAVHDGAIFAPHFRDRETWQPWWAFGKALFGLDLDPAELELFKACTGRTEITAERATEAWLIVGRRGGKSRFLALVAAYLAAFVDWKPYLSPGERGYIVVIAADRRQCRTIMNYIRAFIAETPLLADLIGKDTAEELELGNGLTIEVATCSYRTIRGRTVIAALGDEVAFWADDDGQNPGSEVLTALRPAMATIPGSMMLIASSPYAKRGPIWDAFKRYYGKSDGPLVWRAPTWIMNPALPRTGRVIADAFERDEPNALAEYGAEFRNDVDGYVSREIVEGCVVPGRISLPPAPNVTYRAFVDPSGGSADSFTLAVGHREGPYNAPRTVVDAVVERKPPFSPEEVVGEYCALMKTYRVTKVVGDKYAGEWPREQFRKKGITYEPSAKPKSDLYRDMLPLLNSGAVELLDHPRLVTQITSLERRTARSGKDSIDHAPGGHDDLANAAAGVCSMAGTPGYTLENLC